MERILLRKDLEPWPCSVCHSGTFYGTLTDKKFVCDVCINLAQYGVESEEDVKMPEVNFVDEQLKTV